MHSQVIHSSLTPRLYKVENIFVPGMNIIVFHNVQNKITVKYAFRGCKQAIFASKYRNNVDIVLSLQEIQCEKINHSTAFNIYIYHYRKFITQSPTCCFRVFF